MADWADDEGPLDQRERMFNLIRQTPNLDWLLLTKRPDNITKHLPVDWGQGWPNVWLGATVEDVKHGVPRIDVLRNIPASIRFLSIEPLLEDLGEINLVGIDWAIVGGESGRGAREFDAAWATSLVNRCKAKGIAVWIKQLGQNPKDSGIPVRILDKSGRHASHADNFAQWPENLDQLKIRELPERNFEELAKRQSETDIEMMDAQLHQLAVDSGLPYDDLEEEEFLRHGLIQSEQKLFQTRAEKIEILRGYHKLYAPHGLFQRFLKIANIPKQTAYDWLRYRVPTASTESVLKLENPVVDLETASPKEPISAKHPEKIAHSIQRRLERYDRKTRIEVVRTLAVEFGILAPVLEFMAEEAM